MSEKIKKLENEISELRQQIAKEAPVQAEAGEEINNFNELINKVTREYVECLINSIESYRNDPIFDSEKLHVINDSIRTLHHLKKMSIN